MALFPTNVVGRLQKSNQKAQDDSKVSVVEAVSEENLRERRYFWTARAFAIVFVFSLITNLLMLMALFSLVPLVRVQPYELTFSDKNTQTVTILPFQVNDNVLRKISESMVRQYVTVRHTITADPDEMAFRWGPNGPVNLLSTGNTYQMFSDESGKILEAAVKAGITRSVEINSVIPYQLTDSGEYWNVDYNLVTMSPETSQKEIVPYVATVFITYEPYNGTWENRLKNPIGFKVAQYGNETKASFDAREREMLKDKIR